MEKLSALFLAAARDLTRPAVLWHALWPPVVAFIFWGYTAIIVWAHGIALIIGWLPQWTITGWDWIAHFAAAFLLLAAFASLVYFTSLFLVAVFSLPRMMTLVAERDFPDIVRHGEHPVIGSLLNTLSAGGLFLLAWIVTLPLLLLPGAVLILPVILTGWLNQRTFRFDALVEYARRDELQTIIREARAAFYFAGFTTAVLAYVPIVHFLAPAFTALVFARLGLHRLRARRQQTGIVI